MDDIPKRLRKRFRLDDATGCWVWTGAAIKGYGITSEKGRTRPVRRVVWEATRGPLPEAGTLKSCKHGKLCCNPDHLHISISSEKRIDLIEAALIELRSKFPDAEGGWTLESLETPIRQKESLDEQIVEIFEAKLNWLIPIIEDRISRKPHYWSHLWNVDELAKKAAQVPLDLVLATL